MNKLIEPNEKLKIAQILFFPPPLNKVNVDLKFWKFIRFPNGVRTTLIGGGEGGDINNSIRSVSTVPSTNFNPPHHPLGQSKAVIQMVKPENKHKTNKDTNKPTKKQRNKETNKKKIKERASQTRKTTHPVVEV